MPKKDRPVSGTREWAASNFNCMKGCSHGCLYCYALANAKRFKLDHADSWETETSDPKNVNKKFGKRNGTIMYPTTHDLTPGNLRHTLTPLKAMLEAGNNVLLVSKPHLEVIDTVCHHCEPYRDQLLFRFTIGAADDVILKFWEPGAPNFMERWLALGHAHQRKFRTSVSMEPLLETNEDTVVELVEETLAPHVTDSIWIGKMNKPEERLKRNGHWDREDVQEMAGALMASQSDERIMSLYERLKDHPLIKWKESIKEVVGIEVPTEAGLDI